MCASDTTVECMGRKLSQLVCVHSYNHVCVCKACVCIDVHMHEERGKSGGGGWRVEGGGSRKQH